jgi:hypothetical protein
MLLVAACSSKTVSMDELKKYPFDSSHGLIQVSNRGGAKVEVYYKPKELIFRQELKDNADRKAEVETRKNMDSLDYFVFRLSRNGHEIENDYANDPEMFNKVIDYLSFSFGNDVYMIHKKDTMPMLDFSYARMFGTSDACQLLTVFKSDLKTRTGKVTICFDDTFLGTGLSSFEFEIQDIKNIPPLN